VRNADQREREAASELYSENRIMPDLGACRFADWQEDFADSCNRHIIIGPRRALAGASSAPSAAPT
jgi:hypothetical protein